MTASRRSFLQGLAAAGLIPQLPAWAAPIPWRNWSGSQQCLPSARHAPADIAELQTLIRDCSSTLRPVGAGHSFTSLVPTDGEIVSLARISGLIDQNPDTLEATFYAGTQLSAIGAPLHEVGQALINMPDIDEQILAGAMATGTHGTGATLKCLPAYVTGLELITANGDALWCDREQNPGVFEAARLSLGALGVVSKLRLQNTRPYFSRKESCVATLEDVLANAERMADQHRNFEFYYIPFTDRCIIHTHDLTEEERFATPVEDPNEGVMELKAARDWLGWSDTLRGLPIKMILDSYEKEVSVEASWLNYASERNVRFNEMEYHLPREHGMAALREVRKMLERKHDEVFFPLEVRFIAADDVWLSPFYQRESVSIAIHRYYSEDYQPFFDSIEPIFRRYGGRPHWGKINSMTRADFRQHYEHWDDFVAVRQALDPDGKFLNPYLSSLFGEAG